MRLPDDPQPGLVLSYAYLWKREFDAGLREGRKDRPVVVVLARRDLGPAALLYVAPISHRAPDIADEAVEIPPIVKDHLGLDDRASFAWATEFNVFVWPGPDLRPIRRASKDPTGPMPCHYGYLPRGVFRSLRSAIEHNRRRGALRVSRR